MYSISNAMQDQMAQTNFNDIGSIEYALRYALKKIKDCDYINKLLNINEIDNEYNICKSYIIWAYKRLERKSCDRKDCWMYNTTSVYNCKIYQCKCKYYMIKIH